MVVCVAGKHMHLWRAVNHEGEVLESSIGSATAASFT
jgi:transposase-like protein